MLAILSDNTKGMVEPTKKSVKNCHNQSQKKIDTIGQKGKQCLSNIKYVPRMYSNFMRTKCKRAAAYPSQNDLSKLYTSQHYQPLR